MLTAKAYARTHMDYCINLTLLQVSYLKGHIDRTLELWTTEYVKMCKKQGQTMTRRVSDSRIYTISSYEN